MSKKRNEHEQIEWEEKRKQFNLEREETEKVAKQRAKGEYLFFLFSSFFLND